MMNTHPTREEDFDLYALGALEGDERVALEAHVSGCAACSQRLAEARGRISLLAFAAPAVEPSPAVKQRLLSQIRETQEAGALESRLPFVEPEPHNPRSMSLSRPGIMAWAFCALLVVSIFLWRDNARLERDLAQQRALLAQEQSEADATRKALAGYTGEAQARTAIWTGWISDSQCGAKGMNAAHKDCAMHCIKQMNARWVFVETKTKKIYTIHNQLDVNPDASLGAEMKVTGWMMDDGTLQVEKISASR